MKFRLIAVADPQLLAPLTCTRSLAACPVGGMTLAEAMPTRWLPEGEATTGHVRGKRGKNAKATDTGLVLVCADLLWPSPALAKRLRDAGADGMVADGDGTPLAWISADGRPPANPARKIPVDKASRLIRHPWDLLAINEEMLGALDHDDIRGMVRQGVTIDGHAVIGEGTVLLPGVYLEGNVIIGRNCKVGPNCYLRGNTAIGDRCHIGQAVEIKNSLLMDGVAVGHLSYVGDSIIGADSNLGAGTITANFRHDGKNHHALAGGIKIDTGRRKLGAILGDGVHTGIHTGIYPGRKIWPGLCTDPGAIVRHDLT